MKAYFFKYLHFLVLFCIGIAGFGQEIDFSASVSENPVRLREKFKIKFTIKNAKGKIERPPFKHFKIVGGPTTSSKLRIINGKRSSETSYTYYLKPKKKGTYTIQKAKAKINGKILTSDPIEVKVIKGREKPKGIKQNSKLITRIIFNKNKVYKGEEVIATFILYSRYSNLRVLDYKYAILEGF
ncbi:MAG: BatD family protein, partial [Flavobacteriales bacterium]